LNTATTDTVLPRALAAQGFTPNDAAATRTPEIGITLADKFAHGNLTIEEVCCLKPRSKAGFYEDLKAGLVTIRKIGRRSVVPGDIARRYISGERMAG
jgi:hypothetical protein